MPTIIDRAIKLSFYLLFFLVPLVFYAGSFELFEFNKMMLVYGLTVIITAAWLSKLISSARLADQISNFQAGPIGIPLLLYLISHILSTVFSIDSHISIWGYYSRFHEGLLATISYVILYFAAVNNLTREDVFRILKLSFIAAAVVSLWGALEHFGHSPSCLIITGRFTADCWIQDVKTRVFATLGQPNWMAAYLDIILLSVFGFLFSVPSLPVFRQSATGKLKTEKLSSDNRQPRTENRIRIFRIGLVCLFFAVLLFTKSRSGVLGLAAGSGLFFVLLLQQKLRTANFSLRPLFIVLLGYCFIVFIFGLPFSRLEKFSLENFLTKQSATGYEPRATSNSDYLDIGVSESGDIRKIVWSGALKIWQRYPIFGSGVETFAYAYYLDRPREHNMVSEWDFLYNKAHNEYLNLLATTGTAGFLGYLSILGAFLWWFLRLLRTNNLATHFSSLISALFAAWVSILVTNFFGFSVVIVALYFFLLPAFCFILSAKEPLNNGTMRQSNNRAVVRWLTSGLVCLSGLFCLLKLASLWLADRDYAYGHNLLSVQEYTAAYFYLSSAAARNFNEPTFRDDLAYNQAILAGALFLQSNDATSSALAGDLVYQAIANSDAAVKISPQALPFWKSRAKIFYQLSIIDKKYLGEAVTALRRAAELAPTDAKVHYNLALFLETAGRTDEALTFYEKTAALKPDYRDAHYRLGLMYAQSGRKEEARKEMEFILTRLCPDEEAKQWLGEAFQDQVLKR